MTDAANLVGVPCAREIFTLVRDKERCLTELFTEMKYSKETIAKYVGQMEMVGVLLSKWVKGTDGRWRRYYYPGNAEWARLFSDVIALEQEEAKAQG